MRLLNSMKDHDDHVENGGRKGGRHGIDGLCVVTKTNAYKTVRCESVERRQWRNVTLFWWELG